MCGTGGADKPSGGGNNKPAKKNKTLKDIVTPTKESIAKNKVAGAKFTADQKAKGIGIPKSNITDSSGNAIKGVTNSETNPALVKLAKEGKSGAEGLKELSSQQSDSLDKDTSFTGIYKSIASGEVHKPVQSLLEFGKGKGANAKADSKSAATSTPTTKLAIPSKASSQSTAPSSGSSAGASIQPVNVKNMLAINRKVKAKGKRILRKAGSGVAIGAGGVGLNITT